MSRNDAGKIIYRPRWGGPVVYGNDADTITELLPCCPLAYLPIPEELVKLTGRGFTSIDATHELRLDEGHILFFTASPETPSWWRVSSFGSPDEAMRTHPEFHDVIETAALAED